MEPLEKDTFSNGGASEGDGVNCLAKGDCGLGLGDLKATCLKA